MGAHLFVLPFLHFGVGRLAADLMLALRATGRSVVAVTCGWTGELGDDPDLLEECRAAGIHFEHADVFAREPESMDHTARALDECCARWKPVVGHAFTAVAAAAVRSCPVVASAVGWSPTKALWQREMDVAILERCAIVTAVSQAVADELRHAGLCRQPVIIPNGVRIPQTAAPLRQSISVIGAVAQLIPRKGIDVLLEALSMLPPGTFERVRIAGSGESAYDLEQIAGRLRIPCAIDWCGHVRLEEFFPTIDALVIPSRSDALPLVLLEAMAAGVPVVATRTGGIPEALQPDEGWLVEPGNARALADGLSEVAQSPVEASRRAARAHVHARNAFSVDRMLKQYLACYASAGEAASHRA